MCVSVWLYVWISVYVYMHVYLLVCAWITLCCVYVYVLVCVNLWVCVCVHAAKLGAYRDHMFFPFESIEVSGKVLGTRHVLNPWQGADTAATQEASVAPPPTSREMAQEGEALGPAPERLSIQAAIGEAAQGKCRWPCPVVQMFSFLPIDGSWWCPPYLARCFMRKRALEAIVLSDPHSNLRRQDRYCRHLWF